jgi:LMBR1 domain-containing protein 1
MIALAWIIFAGVVAFILLLNTIIVKYYVSRYDSEAFPQIVAVIALSLILMCVLLIPVDIYTVGTPLPDLSVKHFVGLAYIILYSAVLVTSFVLIPFAYFFYEAYDPESTLAKRFFDAFKYTVGFLLVVIILFIVGLFLKPGDKPNGGDPFWEWVNKLLGSENQGQAAVLFAVACLSVIGLVSWVFYTAYGLSAFPIGMLRGRRRLSDERREYEDEIKRTQENREVLKFKEKTAKKRDVEAEESLLRRERALQRRMSRLERVKCIAKCCTILRPFTFLFGLAFLLLTILIVVSISLTALDKILNSYCGANCGFILKIPHIFNPLDKLLVLLSAYFPMDYVVLSVIVLYIFFATMNGITRIGIRFLWVHMYSFRKGKTMPQGLLLAAVILVLSVLVLNIQLITLAPQYATFGSQTYQPANTTAPVPCSIDYTPPNGNCTMTQIADIVHGITLRMTFFSVIFYWTSWVFIAFFLIGLLVALCRRKSSNIETYSDDDEVPEGIN